MSRVYITIKSSDQVEVESIGPDMTPRPDAWIKLSDEVQIWAETSEMMERVSLVAAEVAELMKAFGK